jgi:UDP-2,3-diacylglucosamine pyrophosphatase LpxH
VWLAALVSSRPDRRRVNLALTRLHRHIRKYPGKKGPVIPFGDSDRFIIFSDQHKGAKDGADDFAQAEPNYLAALSYYDLQNFHLVSLGDGEEFWENRLEEIKKHNQPSFLAERKFLARRAFTKIVGNHDLNWTNDPFAPAQLKEIYGEEVKVLEGALLKGQFGDGPLTIFCTHGHQGDAQSDGNWFSKFFVSRIWGPLQSYLSINPNTPSCNYSLKTVHNQIMYEWSSQQTELLLITGHTHQPVFASMTQLESLRNKLAEAQKENKADRILGLEAEIKLHQFAKGNDLPLRPTYFNSGCCCFNDGDITGIEISEGRIRLVKWEERNKVSTRIVLEETTLTELVKKIKGG